MYASSDTPPTEMRPGVRELDPDRRTGERHFVVWLDQGHHVTLGLTLPELEQLSDVLAVAISKAVMASRTGQVPGQMVLDA